MNKPTLSLLALMLIALNCQAEITEAQIAADCAKISQHAQQGEAFYKAKNYPKARESFELQAAWQEECDVGDQDRLATAYNNVALTWIRQGEYRKAQAWLAIMPNDKKSKYNLSLIQDKLDALPKPTSLSGEYWRYARLSTFQILTLKPLKIDTYQADWQGVYFGPRALYYGPNLGDFSEVVTLKNGEGDIVLRESDDAEPCILSLTKSSDGNGLTIKQSSDSWHCGFGHNVSADGDYLRVN
ncbi:tetratricopeptide repeat protein [Ectopseudomonas mendocina]|uniref:Tetratricopeptide repeat protein n=1 Tax=Ectopseudomonas mendocina TaxID=300 RepID=A0ABZ2RB51_ECTME